MQRAIPRMCFVIVLLTLRALANHPIYLRTPARPSDRASRWAIQSETGYDPKSPPRTDSVRLVKIALLPRAASQDIRRNRLAILDFRYFDSSAQVLEDTLSIAQYRF